MFVYISLVYLLLQILHSMTCTSRGHHFFCSMNAQPTRLRLPSVDFKANLLKYLTHWGMILIAIGYLPVSPYTAMFVVRLWTPSTHLRYFIWKTSYWSLMNKLMRSSFVFVISNFMNTLPAVEFGNQTCDPYVRIGSTRESNRFMRLFTVRALVSTVLLIWWYDRFDLVTRLFMATLNEPFKN